MINSSAGAPPVTPPTARDVLSKVGDAFISRMQDTVIGISESGSNVALLHQATTDVKLFEPVPGRVGTTFGAKIPNAIDLLREALLQGQLSAILQQALIDVDIGAFKNDPARFRAGANVAFGVALLWGVRFEYSLQEIPSPIASEFLYGVIEKIGRLERTTVPRLLGPIFTAAYVLRFYQLKDPMDYYMIFAVVMSRVDAKYKEQTAEVPPFLARNLYDILVYGMQLNPTRVKGSSTLLPEFEEYFPSIRKHFPFHDNLVVRHFGELGFVREQFKADGNTKMVDEISRLRLLLLSTREDLNSNVFERFMLRVWGFLTDWGTSASRVLVCGLLIAFTLFFTAAHLEAKNRVGATASPLALSRECMRADVVEKATSKVLSYVTMRASDSFTSKPLDYVFTVSFFLYYSILLSTLVTFMIRHS